MKLPPTCERPLLEQFLRAESMALRLVRAAQGRDVPENVRTFLRRHEEEEDRHLRQFEQLLRISHRKDSLPRVPHEWPVLAVHLFGYELLGLEFARLLAGVRVDLSSIMTDEASHVVFFENEIRKIAAEGESSAQSLRRAAQAWRRRLPATVDRYLHDEAFRPFRDDLRQSILDAVDLRFEEIPLPKLGGDAERETQ